MSQIFISTCNLNRLLVLTKIAIIVFVGISLLGNFIPFFEGNDSYTLATIAIFLSGNDFVTTNDLFVETGRSEFVPGDWFQTIDKKSFFPGGAAGYHYLISFLYILGNNFSLFYFSPILGIILIITSERIATKLFDKYVGLLTLLFLATNHLFFRGSQSLGVDVLFSIFFIIGSYFLIKFFEDSVPKKIFLASLFFVLATFVRVNGIVYFPIEILIIVCFFTLIKIFDSKNSFTSNFSILNKNRFNLNKKNISKISFFVIIPWIGFMLFWFGYNDYFFGDPFTNYVIEQRGYENTDAKLSSLWTIEQKHFENFKQFSKYLLPYQFPAMEKQVFNQFNNLFGTYWLGIFSIIILAISIFISFKTKQHRIKLLIFTTFIISTIWFFASMTTEERASFGIPGRYMMPLFTIFYMIIGFAIVSIFRKCNNIQNISLRKIGRILQGTIIVLLSIFFLMAFYFIPPSELLKNENFEIQNPIILAQGHPPEKEGIVPSDIILAVKTDRVIEYGSIPFRILPVDENPSDSIDLLKKLINSNHDVFIFKNPTSIHEKDLILLLMHEHGFVFKDYSPTFCKISSIDSSKEILVSDPICIN